MSKFFGILLCLFSLSCASDLSEAESSNETTELLDHEGDSTHEDQAVAAPSLIILGTIQDAGSPHIACHKVCCESYHDNPDPLRMVVSLGFIDPINQEKYLFEASPDISEQLALLSKFEVFSVTDIPDGVFLTHAHIGHYTGLMYFGKEATNTNDVPVFAMPRMREFLATDGPWDQLVSENNIELTALTNETKQVVSPNLSVIPFTVPHRDEYSETVGYKIIGPNKTVLFIPDIDKWEKWEKDILKEIEAVDYALLDATFYDENELQNREISEIPHPLVSESIAHFSSLSAENKDKVYFIHFNHTNPILDGESGTVEALEKAGYHQAFVNQVIEM